MSFRTVVISSYSKLSYKNRYLCVKNENDEKYIHLSEIDTLIVDSISSSITTNLLKEISDNKINLIFCDEKHNPFGELKPYYSRHNSSKKIMLQTKWTNNAKDRLWKYIIQNKITNQALLLKKLKKSNYKLLVEYSNEVQDRDKTNREGHSAKIYFNTLFGKDFIRNNDDKVNAALNYGYAILLSTVNKEIVSNGYLTQLGVNHKNEFNPYNLACDLMEPFRIVIDNFVYFNKERNFDTSYKMDLVNIFNDKYTYNKKSYTLKDIIKIYTKNIFDILENNNIDEYKGFNIYEE